MNIIGWTIIGAVIGIGGHFIDRSPAKGGLLGAILFGVSGALLGGLTAFLLFGSTSRGLDVFTLLIALSGGLLLLLIQRTLLSQEHKF